jgi:hypothetical protein
LLELLLLFKLFLLFLLDVVSFAWHYYSCCLTLLLFLFDAATPFFQCYCYSLLDAITPIVWHSCYSCSTQLLLLFDIILLCSMLLLFFIQHHYSFCWMSLLLLLDAIALLARCCYSYVHSSLMRLAQIPLYYTHDVGTLARQCCPCFKLVLPPPPPF